MQHGRAVPGNAPTERQRSAAERSFVLLLCGTFAGIVIALVGMRAKVVYAQSQSRDAMGASLAKVGRHQSTYRMVHGRFATWPELEARGERLDAGVEVVRSSATASHWYMQLLHRDSGLVCERIHDLTAEWNDESAPERCREMTAP